MKMVVTNDCYCREVTVKNVRPSGYGLDIAEAREFANKHIKNSGDPNWFYWHYRINDNAVTIVYIKNKGG